MIKVKIFRFKENSFSLFEIEKDIKDNTKVLEILNDIKREKDDSIKFMQNCSHGICGSCAMKINGKPALACKSSVKELIEKDGEIILEPLNKNYANGDLTVDFSPFIESFKQIPDYIIPDKNIKKDKSFNEKNNEKSIENSDNCIRCGICFYSCPVIKNKQSFLGPSTASKNFRFLKDFREPQKQDKNRRLKISNELSWSCLKCYKCTEFCPREVDPFSKIEKTHSMIINQTDYKSVGVSHAKDMAKQIGKKGIFDELKLAMVSIGPFKSMKFAPYGIKQVLTLNYRILKKPKNYKEIKKLLESSDE